LAGAQKLGRVTEIDSAIIL